jgi:hypothetical protein
LINKINKTNKQTLLKIKNLISFITNEDIEDDGSREKLIEKMNNIIKSDDFKNKMIEIEKNNLDRDILNIRINSIKKTWDIEEYNYKYVKDKHTIYEYSSKIVIYPKLNNEYLHDNLFKNINEYDYKDVIWFYKEKIDKKITLKKKIIKKKNFNKNMNNKITSYEKIVLVNLSHTK